MSGSGHGLSPREQAIMDAHDADEPATIIADRLSLDLAYVLQIIRTYDFGRCWSNSDSFHNRARAACRAHAAALAATGRSYA